MNWGKKLTIGMLLFMTFIVVLSARMIKSRTELVAIDYYEKSVDYDTKVRQRRNYEMLSEKPEIIVDKQRLVVLMKSSSSGTIIFYRPGNRSMDFERKFSCSRNDSLVFTRDELASGHWKLILQWRQGGEDYFTEEKITL